MIAEWSDRIPLPGWHFVDWKAAVLKNIPPERLADILDITEDGVVSVDAQQRIVLFNRGAAKLFGYTLDEIAGQPLERLLPERFHASHAGQVADFGEAPETARAMGIRREVAGQRKDGTEFPAEVSISKFATPDGPLFTAIVRDVTERKRFAMASQELERLRSLARIAEAETQYRDIVETAHEGIWELDAENRVTFVNGRMAEFLGRTIDDIRGRHAWDFAFEDDATALRALLGRRRGGTSEQADVRFRNRAGEAVWMLMSSRSKADAAGAFCGSLDLFTDISARRRAEESLRDTTRQLWQAARLAGVGELAASIAHELNNPLGTVSLRLEQVLGKTPSDDPRRRSLEIVVTEVERMAGLVGNLLQFSRAGREQISTVDITEEVAKTVELVGHHLRNRRICVEPKFVPGVPYIHADRQQLRQVFLNLFTNAADAMPEGGRLLLHLRPGQTADSRPGVVFELTDTGTGIPAHLLGRVFDPFFTTKDEEKGTGLGLAICRRIVEQHLGTLEIESELGRGTTVRMILPVRPDTNVTGLQSP